MAITVQSLYNSLNVYRLKLIAGANGLQKHVSWVYYTEDPESIEFIRGVNSDGPLNNLISAGLIEEVGRLDAPGRPILFGTTEEFLRSFGLSSVEDLPELSPEMIADFKLEAEQESQLELDI